MWIECLLEKLSINNLNQLDNKKEEITGESFLSIINSLLVTRENCGENCIKGLEGINIINILEEYENSINLKNLSLFSSEDNGMGTDEEKNLTEKNNIQKYELKDIFILVSTLIKVKEDFKNIENRENLFEKMNEESIKPETINEIPDLKNIETLFLLQKILDDKQNVINLKGGKFLHQSDSSKKHIHFSGNKGVEYIKSGFFDNNLVIENVIPEMQKNMPEKENTQNADVNKDLISFRTEINQVDYDLDNTFKNLPEVLSISKESEINIPVKHVEFYEKGDDEIINNLNMSSLIEKTKIIDIKEKEHEKSDGESANDFHMIARQNYHNTIKNDNTGSVFTEKIIEVKEMGETKNFDKEKIMIKKENESTITLIMEPKDIGKVKVTLTIQEGMLKAEVYPNNETARNYFRENIDKIIASMNSEGISLGQFVLKDNRENRKNGRDFERHERLNSVDSITHPVLEKKKSTNLSSLSIYV